MKPSAEAGDATVVGVDLRRTKAFDMVGEFVADDLLLGSVVTRDVSGDSVAMETPRDAGLRGHPLFLGNV